jgi:hypothetical protein
MSTFRGSEECQPLLSLLITTDRYHEGTGVTGRQAKWTTKEWRKGIMVQRLICLTNWREARSAVPESQSGQFKPRLALSAHRGEEMLTERTRLGGMVLHSYLPGSHSIEVADHCDDIVSRS